MSEGVGGAAKAEGAVPEAGGLPPQSVPTAKRFFLLEYFDEVRKGFAWMRTSPKPDEAMVKKVSGGLVKWSGLRKARVGMVVTVLIAGGAWGLFSAQAAGTMAVSPGGGTTGPGTTGHNNTTTITGTVQENSKSVNNVSLESTHFSALRVTLSWTDEPVGALFTNQPDQLGLNITAPNGKNWSVKPTTTSPVTWSLNETNLDYGPGMGWQVTVVGGTMGDITRAGGLPGPCPRCSSDNSNAYTVKVESAW